MIAIVLILLSVLVVVPPARAQETATAGLTTDDVTRMEQGEVVVKRQTYATAESKSAARLWAYCIVDRPPDATWALMRHYEKFSEFMPQLEKVQVREHAPDAMPEAMKVTETLGILLGTITYTVDLKFDPARRMISWALDKSLPHDIVDTVGTWEFLRYGGGRTLVRYTSFVASGTLVPKFLENYLLVKSLPKLLSNMRRRVESGGTWKKD